MLTKVAGTPLIGLQVMAIAGIIVRIATDPCNHMGFDPRWLWGLYALSLLLGVALSLGESEVSILAGLLIGLGLLGLVAGLAIDHFNILVLHDQWAERGMLNRLL